MTKQLKMNFGIKNVLAFVAAAALTACTGGTADGSDAAGKQRADSDSIANAMVIDSLRQVAERDSAVVKALRDSLAADPSYRELKRLVADEAKEFPKELMPGLVLAGNYIEGREFFYMYIVDERQMDFSQIAGQGNDMRRSMAQSIKNSVDEKGNPMGKFVDLCITCGVNVNYMFRSAQRDRTVTISYTPADLRRIVAGKI